jgi:outer membrane protein
VKNLNLVLNLVLTVAVIVLFYLHFSGSANTTPTVKTSLVPKGKKDSLAPVVPSDVKASDIVYVNIDSLDAHYQYILDNSKQINNRQAALESEYQKMRQDFQKEYEDCGKAAQAGVLSGDALDKVKVQLEAKQNAIGEKENQIRALEAEVQKKQGDMLKKLAEFLARYNSAGHYKFILPYTGNLTTVLLARPDLDISTDVIKGLNEEYKTSKSGK